MDLIKINVFKDNMSASRPVTNLQPLSSIVKLNAKRQWSSPHKLVALSPQLENLAKLLAASMDPDVLMSVLSSVFHNMKGIHSNSVWALGMLESVLSQKEPRAIPSSLIEGVLEMCVAKKDLYSMLEVLYLVRERGIALPEAVWSKIMTVTWHGGSNCMTPISRDRVFNQVLIFFCLTRCCHVYSVLYIFVGR